MPVFQGCLDVYKYKHMKQSNNIVTSIQQEVVDDLKQYPTLKDIDFLVENRYDIENAI